MLGDHFNPFETYAREIGSFPIGVKIESPGFTTPKMRRSLLWLFSSHTEKRLGGWKGMEICHPNSTVFQDSILVHGFQSAKIPYLSEFQWFFSACFFQCLKKMFFWVLLAPSRRI